MVLDSSLWSWGFFGISEILLNLEKLGERIILTTKIKNLLPNREDWRRSTKPIARGTLLGFFLGILPGGGAVISSFVSYALEKKFSKHPEQFGKGLSREWQAQSLPTTRLRAGPSFPCFL